MRTVEPTRNLLIVHTTPDQDLSDWVAVKGRIESRAPDIEVRIATNRQPNPATLRWQARRPSLVFSPVVLMGFAPQGGTVYFGYPYDKHEQARRLKLIGIPIPRTETLSPTGSFDPKEWGDYVIVKPSSLNEGIGIKLVRTVDVPARFDELTAIAPDRYLVQAFIDHCEDGYPTAYRVLSMFGRTLYCRSHGWGDKQPPLAEIAADPHGAIASNDKKRRPTLFARCPMTQISSLWANVFTGHFPNAL